MTRMLVDIHPHIISGDEETYPKTPLGGNRSEWSKERAAPWEDLDRQMKDANVAKAAVVQSSTTYGHDNSYLADTVDTARDRITGVCSIGLMDDDVLWQIRHWIKQRGMSGVRLFTAGSTVSQGRWLNDEKTTPGWTYLSDNGIPTVVMLGQEALPDLEEVIRKFPDLVVILDGVAWTNFVEGPPYKMGEPVYKLAKYPNVYLKVTSRTLRTGNQSVGGAGAVLRELIDNFGSERIAWGSSWPASKGTLNDLAQLLRDAVADLADSDAENISSRTALKLYPALAQ